MRESVKVFGFVTVPDKDLSEQLVRLIVQTEDEMELITLPMNIVSETYNICADYLEDTFFQSIHK